MALTDGTSNGATPGHDPVTGRFLVGNRSEYHTRRERLSDALKALYEAYQADTDADRILLALACIHLDEAARARTTVKRTRESNAARNLLKQLVRKPPKQPTIDEIVGRR